MSGVQEAEPITPAPRRPQPLWNPRSLCFTLPIEADDRLAVFGHEPTLVASARKVGVVTVSVLTDPDATPKPKGETVIVEGYRVPLPDASCDYAIVPVLSEGLLPLLPHELARLVRPNGLVFLGARRKVHAPHDAAALSLREGRRMLAHAGFDDVQAYGIAPALQQPRHLVPWASPSAIRWFVRSAYLPRGAEGAVASRLLQWLPAAWLVKLMFPALGFTARRTANDGFVAGT